MLGSPVECTDSRAGLPFLWPRVSGVVLDPQANRVDYLIVHRGFIGGQDQCVPASYLATAQPGEVKLRIDRSALKEMPPLETKLPDRGYAQRSISEEEILLGQNTLVTGDDGQSLGHFSGVVLGSNLQLERILIDRADHPGIPSAAISSCGESCIQVQNTAVEASIQPAMEPATPAPTLAPGTMVRDPVCDMEVLVDNAPKSEHHGDVYYFCSLACKRTFDLEPAAYAGRARTA
jgi:YHS domain-containing protein